MINPEAAMQPLHPKRDFYCAPWVWVHTQCGTKFEDMEFRQARFLGSHFCEKREVPFVQTPPHRHFGHDLLVASSGSLKVTIEDTETYTIAPGSMFIIPGGNGHRRIIGENVCCCCIELSPDFFYDYLELPGIGQIAQEYTRRMLAVENGEYRLIAPALPVTLVNDQRAYRTFLNHFEECLTAYNQVTPMRAHIVYTLGSLFAQFMLSQLTQTLPAVSQQSTTWRILEIKRWLNRHFDENISIPQLATKANLSPNWFSAVFRETVGVTPKAYLISLRLEHAVYLLLETELSITEIAHRVGYSDLVNFIHAFECRYCESPRIYRQRKQHAKRSTIHEDPP